MEAGASAGVMEKLLDRLSQESDPGEMEKTLKELSSVPILCDSLAEIGFLPTIKCLKKQQLLVPFVKDLVDKWSTGLELGQRPEQEPRDIGWEASLTVESQSTSPKEKPTEHGSQEGQEAGREVFFGQSIRRPDTIFLLSQSRKSHTSSEPRAPHRRGLDPGETWSPEQQLEGQNLVHIGRHGASREEPWQHGGTTDLSRKPGDRSDKHKWPAYGGLRKCHPPGQCEQDEAADSGSFLAGLWHDCCPPSSQLLPSCKRKNKVPRLAQEQKPQAKVPRGESRSSKGLSRSAEIPASPSRGQSCFGKDVVQEPSFSQVDRGATSCWWSHRKNHRTPVYSGRRPKACGQQKSQRSLLPEEPTGIREANRWQAGKEEEEPGQSEEKSQPEPKTSRQTPSQPGSSAPLCLQEPEEERLQRLRTRIESTRAKMQARQTIMVTFPSQLKSPGHQGEPGPREAASAQNLHRLPVAPAHPGERGRRRDPAKRPAPLMAKALKDYGRRFSRK